MSAWFNSIVSVIIVSLISLFGILFFAMKAKNLNKILWILVGFATGALLGDVFLHLIPELVEESRFTLNSGFLILGGLIIFFVLEKFVNWRHCHREGEKDHKTHTLATMNLVGDALHNFIDGMIVAGSYLVSWQVGLATTIAVILHEIPQEIGDFGVLLHAGLTKAKAVYYNFLTALTSIIGALFVLATNKEFGLGVIIPITIGGFLYIAGSDLIPELHKEKYSLKTSATQLISIILGILIMYLLKFLA